MHRGGSPNMEANPMNATTLEFSSPLGEPRAAARRMRLFQLQKMVWELMFERFRGVTFREYGESEDAGLIEALRACSLYIEQIEFIGWLEPLVFRIDGIDGNEYIVGFELTDPGFRLNAARVDSASLTLPAEGSVREHASHTDLRGKAGFVEVNRLGDVTIDRAFLVGMSMVIGLMDQPDDDQGDRLLPLVKMITPTREELEVLAARSPAPTVALDDDDPY